MHNLFGVVGQTDNAIIVIGQEPVLKADGTYTNTSDVIHTSQGGINATIGVNNQMFDPGEGAYFTYVQDPDPNYLSGAPGGLTATEADDADNIQYDGGTLDVSSASFLISQIQGNSPGDGQNLGLPHGRCLPGTGFRLRRSGDRHNPGHHRDPRV